MYSVSDETRKPIFEGVQGENEARSIQFDITPWTTELGDGAVTATAKRPTDAAPYPVTVTRDGNTVTWKPTSTDTAFAGVGSFQLEYTVDDVLAKTCIWSTMVAPSLDPAGDPPDPYDNWLEDLREIEASAIQAAEDAINKIPYPVNPDSRFGTSGQLLRTKGDGNTEWSDVGLPTDEQTAQAVTDWLDEHPEATTTVQDGAITEVKFANALKLKTVNYYVTPEMFGAVCDGQTNDSVALQNCINYAAANAIPVKITKNIYINQNINVPSYARIDGATHYEYYPFIIAGAGCSVVFNCTGVCNVFKDFGIRNYDSNYRVLDGIVMVGDSNYNIDTEIDNVHFSTMDRCVVVKGRNVNIHNSFFGQSRIGVHFDLPLDGTQYRGLQVDNCRFHEIGSFEALDWFENSACIWIQDNIWSNLTVRNCIADQSGTFFYGYCTNGLIENNFVEAYAKPIIDINGVGMPANVGSMLILGNTFNGKYGQVAVDVVQPYPEHIVSIKSCGRINFNNNILRNCQYEGVALDSVTQCSINSNVFLNTGISDATKRIAVSLTGSTYINIVANLSETNSMKIYDAVSSSSISTSNNHNFAPLDATNVTFIDNKSWVLLGDCNSQSALTFNLPKEFLVRMNDGRTSFYCHKLDNYITNGVSFSEDGKKFYALTFRFTNGTIVPLLRQYDTANISAPGGLAVKMYFYGLYN